MIKEKITEGFYGCYWPYEGASAAIIAMLDDDCEDHMAKSAVKWIHKKFGVSVMTLSPAHKDYGPHNMPVECIGNAISYMENKGISRFGAIGASTTGMLSLVAASYYPKITLTMAMSPSDFIMEGFYRGKKDGYTEWPGNNESTLSWQGEPLPYLPYAYRHPEYGMKLKEEAKAGGDFVAARKMFEESERLHPVTEEEKIKVERIKGKLLLIGAEDDVLWDTAKYIRRMQKRLQEMPHECDVEYMIYEHGTHFIFPQSLLKALLPAGSGLFIRLFKAGRDYPSECKKTREDVDRKIASAINEWKQ